MCDALLCTSGPVSSVPHLSLEPVFRRSHGSLYKALARGGVDVEALRQVLVDHRPADWPAVFAVDASTWERCGISTLSSYRPSKSSNFCTQARPAYSLGKRSRIPKRS
ncbi:hypothetical protein [Novosphingobium sp.]|uniref:hypothetical protein n=1 Tax=Novosphingobium sp. TaxID=1874826 RepID=UPI003D6CB4F9